MSGIEFLPQDRTAPPPPVPPLPPEASEPNPWEPEPEPEPQRNRPGFGPRTLTTRLVAGVTGLVFILVCAIGAATYLALRSFLSERIDQQLSSTASASLRTFFGPDRFGPGDLQTPQDVYAVALTSTGQLIGYPTYSGLEAMKLSQADRVRLANADPGSPVTIRTANGYELRVQTARPIAVTLNNGSGVEMVAVVGLPLGEEHRTLTHLLKIELVIGASAIALALLATSYGVRFSLRRLRQVTTTANEVAAELSPTGAGLDRRVDVPDDGSEVGQLAESMNTLLSAVETQFAARLESEARLRQFLADASHELRTPLTSIRGYAELARIQKAAGADADDNLSRIESEGTRMSRLVEDLLLLARGDQPGSEPVRELVDVPDLLEDAANGSRAAFPQRAITVDALPGLQVIGDHDQLLRAVRNLVTNAAVHTAPERPILIRGIPDLGSVVIQVIDRGPGLSPDAAAHVFERFWRADKARTRVRGGSGLGLAIVASIVAAHGGTVRFDSSIEYGSTVTIRLPAVRY